MKTRPFFLTLAILAATFVGSAFAAPPPGWTEDYQKAVEKAKAEKKNILLDFTGSDWCGFCKALDREVFSSGQFKSWAHANVVLVKVDFPKSTPQSPKVKQQNEGLKAKFPFNGYPTVVVIDAEGKEVVRKSGYKIGSGPVAYLADFKSASPSKQ